MYKWAVLWMFWKFFLSQPSKCSTPWLLHYLQCVPTIRSLSDGQWGQKENDILQESLYSYGGERDGMYGNPILHGSCRLAGTAVTRKEGKVMDILALKMDKWVRSKAVVMTSSASTKKLQDTCTDHLWFLNPNKWDYKPEIIKWWMHQTCYIDSKLNKQHIQFLNMWHNQS